MAFKSTWIFDGFDNGFSSHTAESNTRISTEVSKLDACHAVRKNLPKDWLKECVPKETADLAVHKSKQDQINEWLEEAICKASILLIVGPSGAGKSTCLKVLASAKNIQVLEWETPLDICSSELDGGLSLNQGQASKFESFLLNSGRYTSVFGNNNSEKLILIKELPNIFSLQPSLLHDILRRYKTMGRTPIVFTFPEQGESGGIISKYVVEELNIKQISFNKLTNTLVTKALKRICKLKKDFNIPSDDDITKIVESANGDLRSALIQFSYESVRSGYGTSDKISQPSAKVSSKLKFKNSNSGKGTKKSNSKKVVKKQESSSKASQALEACGKDRQLALFQCLGRLLYPKQAEENSSSLFHDPEEIVGQTLDRSRLLCNMVFENYLKVFSNTNDVSRAMHYASDCDSMMCEFRDRNLIIPIALSTLVRGFMTCKPCTSKKWTPLTNQEYARAKQRTEVRKQALENANPKYIFSPRDAVMDILPMKSEGFIKGPSQDTNPSCNNSDDEEEFLSQMEGSMIQKSVENLNSAPSIETEPSRSMGKFNAGNTKEVEDTDAAYVIEDCDSDGENVGFEEHANSWSEVDMDFLENLDHF